MPIPFAVFYRNMNLGHPNSPSRAVLEDTFREAGASFARSFQTNGTVLVEVGDSNPRELVDRAAPLLQAACGYHDAAFVRPLDELASVLGDDPFAGASDNRAYRETVTIFDGAPAIEALMPWTNRRGTLEIIRVLDGMALSIVRKVGAQIGNPTAELEAMLGVRATTRTAGTMRRLVTTARDAHAGGRASAPEARRLPSAKRS